MIMKEIWKDLDIESKKYTYQVSNLGRVRRIWVTKDYEINTRLLPQYKNENGYLLVSINNKKYRVHRLVAEQFLESIEGKNQVGHLNDCKVDNRASNLYYCNNKENMNHKLIQAYKGLNKSKNARKIIVMINKDTMQIVNTFNSIKEVQQETGINRKTLYNLLNEDTIKIWKGVYIFDRV